MAFVFVPMLVSVASPAFAQDPPAANVAPEVSPSSSVPSASAPVDVPPKSPASAPPAAPSAPAPAKDARPEPSAADKLGELFDFENVAPPVGRAAPPTEAATRGKGHVRAGLEVFAQYGLRDTAGATGEHTWFHTFDVPRVHVAVEGEWKEVRGRVLVEATRSASEGALIGVAGDSLVLRVREAYAAYRPWKPLEISAGVIPTLTVPNLDGTWMMRPVASSVMEANGFGTPADLGAKARVDVPGGYGFFALAATNGEGYTNREQNRGKNVEALAEVHPLAGVSPTLSALGAFVSYSAGSTGTGRAKANRLTGGLVWQGDRVRGGALVSHAWGLADLGSARALALSAFVRVEPLSRLYLGARFDHVLRDLVSDASVPESTLSTLIGSVGYRVVEPLETFVAVTRQVPTTRARDEVPGSDFTELKVVGRVVF